MPGEKPASLDKDEIIEILKLLDASKFDELRLEIPGLKLVLSKRTAGTTAPDPSPAPASPLPVAAPASGGGEAAAAAQEQEELEEAGLVAVRAPILGIFYRAPQPGAPPFVEVGSEVGADDTLCLIEVMKLFNTVSAGVAGRIARIRAENGKMVEYDQVLFLIAPSATREPSAA